jgi:hypothetical protein
LRPLQPQRVECTFALRFAAHWRGVGVLFIKAKKFAEVFGELCVATVQFQLFAALSTAGMLVST